MRRSPSSLVFQAILFVLAIGSLCQAQSAPPKTAATKLPQNADMASSWPKLKYEKYKLKNGLEVILSEDHRLPLVAVNLWYHVGPANERPGRTGFAHLFEHMMFQGSQNVGEKAHFRYLEAAGANSINGTTDFDRTNYFETLPSNQLELALWLESDRMGFCCRRWTLRSWRINETWFATSDGRVPRIARTDSPKKLSFMNSIRKDTRTMRR